MRTGDYRNERLPHLHSNFSDGKNTIDQMVKTAKDYELFEEKFTSINGVNLFLF